MTVQRTEQMMGIGRRVRAQRMLLGWNQTQLAQHLGCSQGQISQMEGVMCTWRIVPTQAVVDACVAWLESLDAEQGGAA